MNDMSNPVTALAAPQDKRSVPWLKLGVEMGPLLLFFIANARPKLFEPLVAPFLPQAILAGPNAGLFTATLVLMAAVVVALAVSLVKTRKLPAMPLLTAVMALIFGALTLYLQDTSFIKMKPTVLYVGFGVALFGGLAMNKLLLPIIFENAFAITEKGWRALTIRWGAFFFLLALLNELVWRTQSNDFWVYFKFPGILILIFVFSVAQAPLIVRYKLEPDPIDNADV
ncbi:septation protein A [Methylocapsa acidiphila]|uniref:septation protein A n=1 Tax=Methylocapsa acidiphila TaxID=133552 RepID=UPI000421CF66|nr:septation protein A [Methylocapsa acidiphila]